MQNDVTSAGQQSASDAVPRDVAVYHSDAALDDIADSLARASQVARTLGDDGNSSYVLVNRTQSAKPERHARWMDVMMVRRGSATMVLGGRMQGASETSPGEESGGTILGGESQRLGPGDLVVVPAGVPHQILLSAGESIQYVTVKVPSGR